MANPATPTQGHLTISSKAWLLIVLAIVAGLAIFFIGKGIYDSVQERTAKAETARIVAEQIRQKQKAQSFQGELSQLGELQVGIEKSIDAIIVANNSVPKLCNDDPSGCEYFKQLNREYQEESLQPALKNAVSAYNVFALKIPSDVLDYAGYQQKYGDDGKTIQ